MKKKRAQKRSPKTSSGGYAEQWPPGAFDAFKKYCQPEDFLEADLRWRVQGWRDLINGTFFADGVPSDDQIESFHRVKCIEEMKAKIESSIVAGDNGFFRRLYEAMSPTEFVDVTWKGNAWALFAFHALNRKIGDRWIWPTKKAILEYVVKKYEPSIDFSRQSWSRIFRETGLTALPRAS